MRLLTRIVRVIGSTFWRGCVLVISALSAASAVSSTNFYMLFGWKTSDFAFLKPSSWSMHLVVLACSRWAGVGGDSRVFCAAAQCLPIVFLWGVYGTSVHWNSRKQVELLIIWYANSCTVQSIFLEPWSFHCPHIKLNLYSFTRGHIFSSLSCVGFLKLIYVSLLIRIFVHQSVPIPDIS